MRALAAASRLQAAQMAGPTGAGEIAVHAGWARNGAPPSEPERLACAVMSEADTAN